MSKKFTTEEFIIRAIKIQGIKYEYCKVNYVNNQTKVIIICPIHGDFEQQPANHLQGKGCNKCAYINKGLNLRNTSSEVFIRAHKIHNNKYDYTQFEYITNTQKSIIICPTHGNFKQQMRDHLSGYGCPKCGINTTISYTKSNTKEFIKKAKLQHGTYYDYSLVEYKNNSTKIRIICPEHGEFVQRPQHHLLGNKCPACAEHGFNLNKPAILYYLSINNGQAYKIGITNRTVNERFSRSELESIKILKTWEYAIGKEAYLAEQFYLKEYFHCKYKGQNLLKSGNTELFTIDILELDV